MPERFLPIGTICRLEGSNQMVAITGFCIKNENMPGKVFDYVACYYPQGVTDLNKNILFDHNQITQVLYMGFVNEEERLFKQKVNNYIASKEKETKQYDPSIFDMDIPVATFVEEE